MIGFDLQEVDEIKDAEKLLKKIALDSEVNYIHRFKQNFNEKVATLWAVKEATFKALCSDGTNISYKDIELCHKESGAPYITLHGKALEQFESLKASVIEVSLSHQKTVVGAVVLIR